MPRAKKEPKPKTTREERGRMFFEATFDPTDTTGRKVEGSIEEGFTVTNSKGGTHSVEIISESEGQCSCKDFEHGYGRLCKHIHAAMFLAEKQKAEQNNSESFQNAADELSAYELY